MFAELRNKHTNQEAVLHIQQYHTAPRIQATPTGWADCLVIAEAPIFLLTQSPRPEFWGLPSALYDLPTGLRSIKATRLAHELGCGTTPGSQKETTQPRSCETLEAHSEVNHTSRPDVKRATACSELQHCFKSSQYGTID